MWPPPPIRPSPLRQRLDLLRAYLSEPETNRAVCRRGNPDHAIAERNDRRAPNDVRSHGEAVKHIRHPVLAPLAFEYSAFVVDGRLDLSMVVYNLATPADAAKITS